MIHRGNCATSRQKNKWINESRLLKRETYIISQVLHLWATVINKKIFHSNPFTLKIEILRPLLVLLPNFFSPHVHKAYYLFFFLFFGKFSFTRIVVITYSPLRITHTGYLFSMVPYRKGWRGIPQGVFLLRRLTPFPKFSACFWSGDAAIVTSSL